MKSAHEISLEAKKKAMLDTVNKSDDESVVCLFERMEEINERLIDISDSLDRLPNNVEMMSFNIMLKDTVEKIDSNAKKCNEMINELKGVVLMARASVAEKKDLDVKKLNNFCHKDSKNCNKDEQIQDLICQVHHLSWLINQYEQKKWWEFWK